jgi:ATP/maltotriose-dependent transcriptional regulator MalT
MYSGFVELLAGQPDAAERELSEGYAVLEQLGERQRLSTTAAFLARACFAQDRWDEAERFTRISEESASKDDVVSQVMWRGTRSKILAGKGEAQHAEELAHSAVTMARDTDFVILHADALSDLACVEAMLRRPRRALRTLDEAVALYAHKGSVVSLHNSEELRRSLGLVAAES